MHTILALYDDFSTARSVIEELVDAGYNRDRISMIANDANKEYARYLETDDNDVDADEGAGFGAVIGTLIGFGAVVLPGIGPVVAGGSLAAALLSAGVGAAAGAITGGLAAALIDLGVPEEDAELYYEGVRRGGVLVAVQVAEDHIAPARSIMNRHNPVDLDSRRRYYEETGWKGYDFESDEEPEAYTYDQINADRERWNTDREKFEVVEEDVKVGKREVERGGVRIRSYMTETPVEEQVKLREEHIEVERRAVNRPATEADFELGEREIVLTEHGEEIVIEKEARVVEEVVVDKETDVRTETVHETARRKNVEVQDVDVDFNTYEPRFRKHYETQYQNTGYDYNDYYLPVYQYGYILATEPTYRQYTTWTELEPVARKNWEAENDSAWEDVKETVRKAWNTVKREVDELV